MSKEEEPSDIEVTQLADTKKPKPTHFSWANIMNNSLPSDSEQPPDDPWEVSVNSKSGWATKKGARR
jgi:hypothetical protein